MSTLDEITQEKQRVSEALARIDAQRQKLAGQLGELEATERVLARYSTGTKRTVSAKSSPSPTKAVAPAQRQRGRRPATTAKPGDGRRTSATLSDQVLALATGRTRHEIASAENQDRTYVFQRKDPAVVVFDREVKYLGAWGQR